MSFDFSQIDTGGPKVTEQNLFSTNRAANLVQNVRDNLPANAPQTAVDARLAELICGEMRARKTYDGKCNAFWAYAAVIGRMREHSPDMHDMIVLEFAEQLTLVG